METLSALALLGGIGIPLYQVYQFLLTGEWYPISALMALQWMGIEWASHPETWLGLHKVLDFMPLSITLLALSMLLALFGVILEDSRWSIEIYLKKKYYGWRDKRSEKKRLKEFKDNGQE